MRLRMNSDRLILKGRRWRKYYAPTMFLIFIAIFSCIMPIIMHYDYSKQSIPALIVFDVFWFVYAIVMGLWQYQALKFEAIPTDRTASESYEAIISMAKKLFWTIQSCQKGKYIEASVPSSYQFQRWSALVTIHFFDGKVLANSIQYPDRGSSRSSYDNSKKNVQYIRKAVSGRLASRIG